MFNLTRYDPLEILMRLRRASDDLWEREKVAGPLIYVPFPNICEMADYIQRCREFNPDRPPDVDFSIFERAIRHADAGGRFNSGAMVIP